MVFFAILAAYYLYRSGYLRTGYRPEHAGAILRFGLPLIPHVLGSVIMTYSDRLFISNMVGMHEMGLYAVGYQVGMVISLFQNSFNQAWQPWLFDRMKNERMMDKARIVKFTYLYFIIILIMAAGVSLASPLIISLMTSASYRDAVPFISWIAFGFAFNGMYKMVVNYLFYLRRTMWIAAVTLLTALLSICLNYFLILLNGPVGAAQASAIAFFVQFIFIWWMSAKNYSMPWVLAKARQGRM